MNTSDVLSYFLNVHLLKTSLSFNVIYSHRLMQSVLETHFLRSSLKKSSSVHIKT